jgi:hypothetical protein
MIPKNITRQHILSAIAEIDRAGTPDKNASRKFSLPHNGRSYAPKYVVSLANVFANGTRLASSVFNGGAETNDFLRSLSFTINGPALVSNGTQPASQPTQKRLKAGVGNQPVHPASITTLAANPANPAGATSTNSMQHSDERCKECKRVLKKLLEKLYGRVEQNHKLTLGTRPDVYKGTQCHAILGKIFLALQRHRGFTEFVGVNKLPPSDFFVPNPGFLVEFDESQHFTTPRSLALSLYPNNLDFGFDIPQWMNHCDEIQARDNDPPFRDEQRAWYDTLRDFAPQSTGTLPTLRLQADEFEWCSLDPDDATDVETFRHILGQRANFWHLDFRVPEKAPLARIAIDGAWRGDGRFAKKLLDDIVRQWPSGVQVHCISTCGAFLTFDWPEKMPYQADNRFPDNEAIETLDGVARKRVQNLLDGGLRQRLAKFSKYLTVGIDSFKSKISSTDNYIPDNHAELVYIVNLQTSEMQMTGKSYPTTNQEGGLLRILDLDSHFAKLDGVPTMVLGCHDLTMFNARSDAKATGWRLKVKNDFKSCAMKHKPRWVLHHPHTTVNPRTWSMAWSGVLSELPSVASYLGTGCYSYLDKNGLNRKPFQSVLDSTKSSDIADIVVRLADSR